MFSQKRKGLEDGSTDKSKYCNSLIGIKQGKSNNAADGSALDWISVWDMKCSFLKFFFYSKGQDIIQWVAIVTANHGDFPKLQRIVQP